MANVYAYGGNVGIGKTNPAYTLDVNGILNASQILQNGAPLSTGGGGGSSQWITSGSNIYYLLGNVGISTNNPTAPLHIYGSGERIRLDGSSATQTYIRFASQGTDRGYIGTGASGVDMVVAAYASQNLIFQAGAAEYMRVTSSGYVGIGTVNPVSLLHVNGGNMTVNYGNMVCFHSTYPAGGSYSIGGAGANLRIALNSDAVTHRLLDIGYYTGDVSTGTWNSRMVVDPINGNVGIGTLSPVYPISVATTGATGLEVNRSGSIDNYGVGTIHSLTSATGSFRGEYAWTIGGATTIATSAQSQAYGYYAIDLANAGAFASNSSYTNAYLFLTTSAACFPKTRVGIGITNPTSNLHVGAGQTANLGGVLQTKYTDMGLSVNSTFTIGYNSSSVILSSGVVTYTLAGLDSNGTFSTSVNIIPGATYLFSWTVKASVASATVYFYGNSNASPSSFSITNTYATYTLQFVASSDPSFYFRPYVGANQSISFNAISITRLDTVATGNVGIGINAPAANLHVYNSNASFTSAPTVQIGDGQVDSGGAYGMVQLVRANGTADSKSHIAFIKNGVSVYSMGYYPITGAGPFGLTTANNMNSSVGLWMATTGNVGIGMTNPTALLQLNTDSAVKPGTTTWSTSSDERLKENIVLADVDRCVEIVRTVPLKHYRWKDEAFTEEQIKDRSKLGWIAQDVEKVFPKAVSTRRFAYNQVYENVVADDGSTEKKLVSEDVIEDCRMFNADQIYAVMYGAIQKLIAANDALTTRIEALESKS
jgi:hypothetical protein